MQRLRVTALLSTLGYALAVLGLVTLHSDQLNRLVARVVPAKPYAVPTFEVVLDGEAASKPLAVSHQAGRRGGVHSGLAQFGGGGQASALIVSCVNPKPRCGAVWPRGVRSVSSPSRPSAPVPRCASARTELSVAGFSSSVPPRARAVSGPIVGARRLGTSIATVIRMAQHKPRSRIAQFKQPFLVGAVTSAALLSGCGGETEGTSAQPNGVTGDPTSPIEPTVPEPGVTSNPPGLFDPRCPQPLPESGDSCSAAIEGKVCSDSDSGPGLICTQGKWQGNGALSSLCPKVVPTADQSCAAYQPDLDCEYVTGCEMNFRCVDGLWQDHSPSCNPPPPETIGECPTEVPTAGDDCTAYEPSLNCEYDGSICPQEFKCEAGTWENDSLICNPPEVLGDCPEERPVVGDGCEEYLVGIECTYDATDSSCPEASSVTCGSLGVWEGPEVICNPPPPELSTECPVELPTPGTSCEDHQVGLHCGEASCDGGIAATCGSNGLWEAFVLACNPPMPEVSESPDGGPLFDAGVGSDAPSGG